MRQLFAGAGALAAGVFVALAALGVLHREPRGPEALAVGGLAVVVALAVRRTWRHLPAYVGFWLDLGVLVVAAVLASVAHALSLGIPFAVLRGPELGALFGGAMLLGTVVAGLAYTHLRLAAEVEASERRMAELERAVLESKLAVLAAQINPHFLFNTLNTLAELVHEDEDAAEDLVTDLSWMMRYALRSSSRRVPLTEELELVRRLLRIEATRLGERLTWEISGEDALAGVSVEVPGLVVQPLVENAVKHAVASRTEGGTVTLAVAVAPEGVRLSIVDDGPGLPAEIADELATGEVSLRGTDGHGGGLRSCLERLRLGWPEGDARLVHDPSAAGTHLTLELPMEAT